MACGFDSQLMQHLESPDAQKDLADEIAQTRSVNSPNGNQPDLQYELDSQRPNDEPPIHSLRVESGQDESMLGIDEHQPGRPDQQLKWGGCASEIWPSGSDDYGLCTGRNDDRNRQRRDP